MLWYFTDGKGGDGWDHVLCIVSELREHKDKLSGEIEKKIGLYIEKSLLTLNVLRISKNITLHFWKALQVRLPAVGLHI